MVNGSRQWVIVMGSPADGHTYLGPFPSNWEAVGAASNIALDERSAWWVAGLFSAGFDEGDWLIVVGDPVSGYAHYGPFKAPAVAAEYARDAGFRGAWVVPLAQLSEETGGEHAVS